VAVKVIRRFFDFMAKMGLSVRDDPPKVVDLSVREFGEARNGLTLSIRQNTREDRDALASVSVVIRNVGQEARIFVVPGWLGFYKFDVGLADGSPAPLTPFGKALAKPKHREQPMSVSLAPVALHETEVPLGSIFSLRPGVRYVVKASCEPYAGVTLESNEIVLS
jgi:hypothetical protein